MVTEKKEKPTEQTPVIDTKPVTQKAEAEITPSKTVKLVSSVVEVKGPAVEKAAVYSVVEVIGGESTKVPEIKPGKTLQDQESHSCKKRH